MRHSGRWQLSDVQRVGVVAAVVTSLFLAAMALGMGNVVLLLVALLLLVVVGLGIFLLGMRFNGVGLQGEAHVVRVSSPPANQIVGRCDMRLVVDLPGRPAADVKLRDSSVPVIKWPRVGQILPVDIDAHRRQLRIRWDLVESYQARAAAPGGESATYTVPFYTDYADGVLEAEYSPTPTADSGSATYTPTPDEAVEPDPDATTIHKGPDRAPRPPKGILSLPPGPARRTDRPEAELADDPSPVEHAEAAGFELPVRGTIPQPRPAGHIGRRRAAPGTDAASTAMGVMLVVSNLARSVRFYRDLVGLEVVDSSATTAVLAYGGGRVLLRQLADMSPVDRRVAHLHISVPDVEAAYEDLRAKGVPFAHRPRIINRSDKLDLWAATFRDPDGHDVALTQWRDREDAAPGR